jgi:hypothetical protein
LLGAANGVAQYASPPGGGTGTEEQLAKARELAASGIELYESGAYPEASQQLEEAYRYVKVPTTGLWSARALDKVGALTRAADRYREVLQMPVAENEPSVFVDARRSAQQELDFLGSRIPVLVIRLHAATAEQVQVTVDDVAIPADRIGVEFPVDPGIRRIVGTMGERAERVTLDMPERSKGSAVLDFSPREPAERATVEVNPIQADAPDGSRKTWGYVALSVGGASLATGIVATILASGQRSDLDQACPERQCGPEFHGQVDTLNTTLTFSLLGYVAAAVGLGTGSYLLLTSEGKDPDVPAASVSLWVGAGSGGLRGHF